MRIPLVQKTNLAHDFEFHRRVVDTSISEEMECLFNVAKQDPFWAFLPEDITTLVLSILFIDIPSTYGRIIFNI